MCSLDRSAKRENEISILDILAILMKYRWMLTIFPLLLTLCVTLYTVTQPQKYRTSALFKPALNPQGSCLPDCGEITGLIAVGYFNEKITSVLGTGPSEVPKFNTNFKKDASVIEIWSEDETPDNTSRVLHELLRLIASESQDEFNHEVSKVNSQIQEEARDLEFLNEELSLLKDQLAETRMLLQELSRQRESSFAENEADMLKILAYSSELRNLHPHLFQIEKEILQTRKYISKSKDTITELKTKTASFEYPEIIEKDSVLKTNKQKQTILVALFVFVLSLAASIFVAFIIELVVEAKRNRKFF